MTSGDNPAPGPEPTGEELARRYRTLLQENFILREKVRNLEEDIEALHWDLKKHRMTTPWREVPSLGRRVKGLVAGRATESKSG